MTGDEMSDKTPDPASGGLLAGSGCVLVIIDIQEKLLPVMSAKEDVLENSAKLVRFAGIIGLPVLVTEQGKLGPTMSDLTGDIDNFAPILKLDFDACAVPEFVEALGRTGGRTVLLAGIESHVCVMQTALSLLARGYKVHVVSDAVSSRTPENRDVALGRMRDAGAVISSAEMAIFELLKRAGTDEFKETLKIVK